MTLRDLVGRWEDDAHGTVTKDTYAVKLSLDDAARIDALSEMYPKRSKEQIITELISAALAELESDFPYIQGAEIVSHDEQGDPIFSDAGKTPTFLSLTKKHYQKRLQASKG